jgi:hypothetical protein
MNRYRVPSYVLRAEMSGEEVLLNPETGYYHLVNATGHILLSRFERGDSLQESVEGLARDTNQSLERVSADVDAFVQALMQRGLLERVNP